MKKNISKPDMIIRIFCGIIAISLVVSHVPQDDFLELCLLVFGALMLITAATRTCPLYLFLGLNTASRRNRPKMY